MFTSNFNEMRRCPFEGSSVWWNGELSVKLVLHVARGAWLLHKAYAEASHQAGAFLKVPISHPLLPSYSQPAPPPPPSFHNWRSFLRKRTSRSVGGPWRPRGWWMPSSTGSSHMPPSGAPALPRLVPCLPARVQAIEGSRVAGRPAALRRLAGDGGGGVQGAARHLRAGPTGRYGN